MPLAIWAEHAQPLSPEQRAVAGVRDVRWCVGLQTLLGHDDPLSDFVRLFRLLGRGIPDAPGIVSVNTNAWYDRAMLEQSMFGEIEPPPRVLWNVTAMAMATGLRGDDTPAWIYTTGLERCGLPELEMLNVPAKHARAAASLLEPIAELLLGTAYPPPGEPMEIGQGITVALQPWMVAAEGLAPGLRGSASNRVDGRGVARTGVSAVVCAATTGGGDDVWIWPRDVVQAIETIGAPIYRSARASRRQAALARATWPVLADAHRLLRAEEPRGEGSNERTVMVAARQQVGLAGIDDRGGEHLWFEALSFEGDRVRARLITKPARAETLSAGQVTLIDRARVSDWRVLADGGDFGPDGAAALRRYLESIPSGPEPRDGR
jgi:uncharacterized protein YegJ (DUF2314 family)